MSDHVLELLPAYALGILPTDEAEMVSRHMAACASCRAEAQAYAAVTAVLPLATPDYTPPADLPARLRQRIIVPPPSSAAQPLPSRWPQLRALFRHRPLWQPALAGVLVLMLLVTAVLQLSAPAPIIITLNGTTNAPSASATLVLAPNPQQATFSASGLPTLPPEQQYQLWLVQNGQRTSGGVFSVDAAGAATFAVQAPQTLTTYDAFGVTIEPAGGSPGPTGDQVLGSHS